MSWYVAPDGSRALGSGGASDADEDMAWALVMAHRQWGGRGALDQSYLDHAKRQIDRIVGCAVGAMHDSTHQEFLDAAYARARTGKLLARSRYYNHCWTVLSLLMLSGNLIEFPE